MTYQEIYEFLYGGDGANSLDQLSAEDRLPWRILQFFDERKGFEWWWGDLGYEIQDEIFEELRKLVNEPRQPVAELDADLASEPILRDSCQCEHGGNCKVCDDELRQPESGDA